MSKAISLTGDRQLDRVLKRMPKRLTRKVVRGALRESAKPMVKAARAKIKSIGLFKTGNLWRSMGIVTDRSRIFKGSIRVGARMKRGDSRNMQGWHAHFFEFGTAPRRPRKSERLTFEGESGGLVTPKESKGIAANPFLRPAFRATHKEVTDEFGGIVGKRLLREMRQTIKRNGR